MTSTAKPTSKRAEKNSSHKPATTNTKTTARGVRPSPTQSTSEPSEAKKRGVDSSLRVSVNRHGILAAESCRAFMISRQNARGLLSELYQRVGINGTCALLSVPEWKARGWIAGERWAMYPVERKAIWLVWSMIVEPQNLRSLFDVATFGRYLPTTRAPELRAEPTAGGIRKVA